MPVTEAAANEAEDFDARRKTVLGVLAHARADALAVLWDNWAEKPEFQVVRGPEVGLVMVRGRTGGGGAPFNLGEATVTRVTVRLASGEIGHSYALGRDRDKAKVAAVLDALSQRPEYRQQVEDLVISPLRQAAADADRRRKEETAATRVNFFTMVRGDD
jgi:alpha-D-ribose 1-methylphosphonate 5-triphosphate synthase subunit PhnG